MTHQATTLQFLGDKRDEAIASQMVAVDGCVVDSVRLDYENKFVAVTFHHRGSVNEQAGEQLHHRIDFGSTRNQQGRTAGQRLAHKRAYRGCGERDGAQHPA